MSQVLIRDLDEKVIRTLKRRAERNNRSLQRELHLIVTHAAMASAKVRTSGAGKAAPARGKKVALRSSVWDWLKRPGVGNLSKQEIDSYIRAERDSWNAA